MQRWTLRKSRMLFQRINRCSQSHLTFLKNNVACFSPSRQQTNPVTQLDSCPLPLSLYELCVAPGMSGCDITAVVNLNKMSMRLPHQHFLLAILPILNCLFRVSPRAPTRLKNTGVFPFCRRNSNAVHGIWGWRPVSDRGLFNMDDWSFQEYTAHVAALAVFFFLFLPQGLGQGTVTLMPSKAPVFTPPYRVPL